MVDLRRVLDVLHQTADTTRQPGLANLDELFDGVRRSGLPVRFQTSGSPPALSSSHEVALYRICQEMLTNALRYGDGTGVDVALAFTKDSVALGARNTIGPPSTEPTTRRGLAGVGARVALLGGSVSYGPLDGDLTWETRVTIPLTNLAQGGS